MSVLHFDELICNIFKSSGVFREEHLNISPIFPTV